MDFENATIDLTEMANAGVVCLRTNKPLIDFTKLFQGTLDIYGSKKIVSLNLSNENDLPTILFLLTTIFDEKTVVICWDIKELVSYFKFHLKKLISFTAKVIDLKLLEAFSGQNLLPPSSLREAIKRLTVVKQNKKFLDFHNKIHKPLALQVIPSLETQGLLHTDFRRKVYPYYEIEGQVNGRLKSSKPFNLALNAHHLIDDDKDKLKLASEEDVFVCFDYIAMEVAVLQYLSGDEVLAGVFDKGDCYENIWTLIFGAPCETPEQRKLIKGCFLPIVFGLGATGVQEKTGCSENAAIGLTRAFKSKFKKSFEYVESYQGLQVEDVFGRLRSFEEDKLYLARNFLIQSPAAAICLEKLIDLYNIVGDKLLLSIHDGYVMKCNFKLDKQLLIKCKEVLTTPAKIAPGLKLNVNCELGFKLNKTKKINI